MTSVSAIPTESENNADNRCNIASHNIKKHIVITEDDSLVHSNKMFVFRLHIKKLSLISLHD